MFLFETIIFSNRIPSYYKVYLQDNKYYFESIPLEYYKHVPFPNFFVKETGNGQWESDGTDNQELIKQAVEDIRKFVPAKKYASMA